MISRAGSTLILLFSLSLSLNSFYPDKSTGCLVSGGCESTCCRMGKQNKETVEQRVKENGHFSRRVCLDVKYQRSKLAAK